MAKLDSLTQLHVSEYMAAYNQNALLAGTMIDTTTDKVGRVCVWAMVQEPRGGHAAWAEPDA